jgi:hypothetical protein
MRDDLVGQGKPEGTGVIHAPGPLSLGSSWKVGPGSLDLDAPLVMGILNLTPDSFSDGGELRSPDEAMARAEPMVEA